jgi:predicted RNA binding protein YcfA (HicA-like mRNA interferase family)
MTFKELERLLFEDGWSLKAIKGSHHQYIHREKKAKITIPKHSGDLNIKTATTLLKQAGLK